MHRNSQKRFYDKGSTYFITTNVKDRVEIFRNEIFCELFIEELRICKEIKKFELYGFCINYDHVHLLLKPIGEYNISQLMFSIKKQFAHDCNRIIGVNDTFISKNEGEQTFARLHEVTINDLKTGYINQNLKSTTKFQWQSSYHDHVIRDQLDFQNHLNYINTNNLKHNLPTNWKYIGYNYPKMIDLK